MTDLFPYYSADPEAVRAAARTAHGAASAVEQLRTTFAGRHRAAVDEAAGDLIDLLDSTVDGPVDVDAQHVQRVAIWAACQIENFADAIDFHNHLSAKPRSVRALNEAYADMAGTANIGLLVQILKDEKAQLDLMLDDAAQQVADNLARQPTEEDLLREWKEGNLPMSAMRVWPIDLRLEDLPNAVRDTAVTARDIANMRDDYLADLLMNPNLSLGLRDLIVESRPDAVAIVADQWELSRDTHAGSNVLCTPNDDGMIVGPDGRMYNVEIPGPRPPSDGPTVAPADDFIDDDGAGSEWRTVTSRDGEIAYGEPIDLGATIAFVLAQGVAKPVGEWQSVGSDQGDYVTTDDGAVYLDTGTPEPGSGYTPAPGGQPAHEEPPDPNTTIKNLDGALGLAIGSLEGANNAQQAEYNRHYSTEVVFQEDADGNRRAVINLYQVQTNGEQIRIGHEYGVIGPDGTVVAAP